jgi:formylmethanofuran dehydrogenase subunit D
MKKMEMLVNTVRMVDHDQLREHSFGDGNSLKENLAIGLLNPEDIEKLNLTPDLNLKLVNEHGQVIIKAKQEKNVPVGIILMPVSIWTNQIIGVINQQLLFKNLKVNAEATRDNILDLEGLINVIKK